MHLKDVATAELGATNYDSDVLFNGVTTVATADQTITATSNPLTVVQGIYELLPQIGQVYLTVSKPMLFMTRPSSSRHRLMK
ncbi:hypothetical protein O9929_26315 [Vibrio lentus]|nr:hypothetical protein [Vibrio lentus]